MKKYLTVAFCLSLVAICFSALAQSTASDSPLPPSLDATAGVLAAVASAFAGEYGWLVQVIAIVGTLRVVMKPLMLIVEAVVKATPSTSDDAAFSKFKDGAIYKWLIWGLDWIASIKPVRAETTNPLVEKK